MLTNGDDVKRLYFTQPMIDQKRFDSTQFFGVVRRPLVEPQRGVHGGRQAAWRSTVAFLRHEQLSTAIALVSALHHSAKTQRAKYDPPRARGPWTPKQFVAFPMPQVVVELEEMAQTTSQKRIVEQMTVFPCAACASRSASTSELRSRL